MMNSIYKKIFKVQENIGRLKKDKENPHFKHSYVDINSVLDEVLPVLNDNKILLIQPTETKDGQNILHTKLISIEDDSIIETSMILPLGLDAQKTGSALTYFRRYQLISLLGLQTVDDDGKAGSNPIKEKKKPAQEMVLEIESLTKSSDAFRKDWLNFLGVESFNKANYGQLEKAIKGIKDETNFR